MSQWEFPRDRDALSKWPRQRYVDQKYLADRRLNPAGDDKSLTALRAENQRLMTLVKNLQLQLAQQSVLQNGGIPEEFQLELMRGRKLARLVREGDSVQFSGIGMNGIYDVEGYAECLMRKPHEVPDPNCSCGFYIPVKLGENGDPRQHWVLDVEVGGKVLDCGMGALPAPARGYRASWQRVLSVTAPTLCQHCGANAEHVCIVGNAGYIEALCPKHAVGILPPREEKPLTWVREHLATELVAPNLTDAPPPEGTLPQWEEDLLRSATTTVWPVTTTTTGLGTLSGTYSTGGISWSSTYSPLYTSGTWPPVSWVQNT